MQYFLTEQIFKYIVHFKIFDSYRAKIQKNINRKNIITRKNIQNIKKSYRNISEKVKDGNDAISIELWIKQFK